MTLEDLRSFCLQFPGTTEDIKWEDHLCFCVGEKMFAVTSLNGEPTLSIKVDKEAFHDLVERDEFEPAPYLARYKWVYMSDYNRISTQQLENLLRQSHTLIKQKLPKRLIKEIEASD